MLAKGLHTHTHIYIYAYTHLPTSNPYEHVWPFSWLPCHCLFWAAEGLYIHIYIYLCTHAYISNPYEHVWPLCWPPCHCFLSWALVAMDLYIYIHTYICQGSGYHLHFHAHGCVWLCKLCLVLLPLFWPFGHCVGIIAIVSCINNWAMVAQVLHVCLCIQIFIHTYVEVVATNYFCVCYV